MSEPLPRYPGSLEIGRGGDRQRYVRVDSELILHFTDEVEEDMIDDHVRELPDVSSVVDLERLPVFGGLRAEGLGWVRYRGDEADMRAHARRLRDLFPGVVEQVTPVFLPVDGDRGEAATPLPGDLLLRAAPEDLPAVQEALGADFEHHADGSHLLGHDRHLFRIRAPHAQDDGFELIARAVAAGAKEIEHDWLRLETFHQAFPADPPSDEFWGDQWNLERVGAMRAWRSLGRGVGVPVAVIESGFDLEHPDLAFGDRDTHLNVEAVWRGGGDYRDAGLSAHPHGTPVTGIVGARTDNLPGAAGTGLGVAGVAGECGIIPIRLGRRPSSGRVALGLAWARREGVRVVNLSLTTVETSTLTAEVRDSWDAGMVLCAAAGNGFDRAPQRVGYPARSPYVIGVGASDHDDRRKSYDSSDKERWQSRYGRGLDVVAPGVDCWTTDQRATGPGGRAAGWNVGGDPPPEVSWSGSDPKAAGDVSGDYLAVFGGTSAAAPHVAGLASLLLAHDGTLTNVQVRHVIERTCRIADPETYPVRNHPDREWGAGVVVPQWNWEVGCGVIDAGAALQHADEIADEPIAPILAVPGPCGTAAPDAEAIEDWVVVAGYLGPGVAAASRAGAGPTLWRIYASQGLDRWLEVEGRDIERLEPTGGGGARFWIRRGAAIREVAATRFTAVSPD